jgi:hypothetical protein
MWLRLQADVRGVRLKPDVTTEEYEKISLFVIFVLFVFFMVSSSLPQKKSAPRR